MADHSFASTAPSENSGSGSSFQICFWIFVSLFAFRLLRAFIFKLDLSNENVEVDRVAAALYGHLGFANPFRIPTGATSHLAPGYPFLLAGIYKLFGQGSAAEAVRQILSCGAACLQFALLPVVAAAANISSRVGILAAVIGGLSPMRSYIETKATFETPYAAMFLVILCLLTLQIWNLDPLPVKRAVLYGMVWGLALLWAPQLLPIFIGFLAVGAIRFQGKQFKSYLRFSLFAVAIAAITLMPWTIRNYRAFGHLIFVRGSFGLELSVSNNDSALPLLEHNINSAGFQTIHPFASLPAAQTILRVGESAYYHAQLLTALRWIRSNPQRFARLTVERIGYFWFPPVESSRKGIIYSSLSWFITLAGMAGLWIMFQRRRSAALTIAVIWLAYPLVYYLLQFDLRYRYPIEWTFLFTASYAAMCVSIRALPGILREQMSA